MNMLDREEVTKRVVAALKAAGYGQIRVKEDVGSVHVLGLGITPYRVLIPLSNLSPDNVKAAIDKIKADHEEDAKKAG